MYKTIFYKEILENFTSRRFFAVLVLCLIIIPLGTYVASRDYQSRLHNYLESVRIYDNDHKTIWDIPSKGGAKGLRPPSPFGFLSLGLEIVMPNVAETSGNSRSTPVDIGFNNNQGLDNVYQFFFGPLDLVFIVSVVMTFFAIIFTYGAISGEKEHGTLGQILSNSVPRNQVIMAKMGANSLALAIPFLISLLIGLLLFQIGGFSLL